MALKPTAEKPKLTALQATLALARRGNMEILGKLRDILDNDPAIWKHNGDLARMLEQSWIERIAGTDLLIKESLRKSVEAMRSELAAGESSSLEKLLVDRMIASWLAAQEADLSQSLLGDKDNVKLAQLRIKRCDAANRRFLAAAKTLATVRRLTKGIEITLTHSAQAAGTPAGVKRRRSNLFDEQSAGEDMKAISGELSE